MLTNRQMRRLVQTMKIILQNILVPLLVVLTSSYANENGLTVTPEYQNIKKVLQERDICTKGAFGITAFNTVIGYKLKGDCSAMVGIYVSKNESLRREGSDLEQLTLEVLEPVYKHKKITQLNATFKEFNKDFKTIDQDGYQNCGASGLFAITGIEILSREMQFLTPLLNKDKHFDCFGKALLDDCKASKFTLLSYLGRELDMHFKIQKEAGVCSLTYAIPVPSMETLRAYDNAQIFPNEHRPLSENKIMEGKLDDVYGFINSKDNHLAIDKDYFEKEYGSKEKNRGAFAFFTIYVQQWLYLLSGM